MTIEVDALSIGSDTFNYFVLGAFTRTIAEYEPESVTTLDSQTLDEDQLDE